MFSQRNKKNNNTSLLKKKKTPHLELWVNFIVLQIKGGIHIIFCLFFCKKICCGYSLEGLTEALLMSAHNICFHGEI